LHYLLIFMLGITPELLAFDTFCIKKIAGKGQGGSF
jgi:hypothetical protein